MGCWNGTCGLSGLPILHGTKVLLFPLVQGIDCRGWATGFCYTTDVWQPATLPIRGTYNDYGSIEEIEPIPSMTKSHLERHFNVRIDSDEEFLRNLERYNMGQVLIREDIWNSLLKISPEDLDASKKDAAIWIEKLKEIRYDEAAIEKFWFSQTIGMTTNHDSSFFAFYLEGVTQLYVLKRMKYQLGSDLIKQKCPEEHLVEFSNSLAEVLHVDSMMSGLRKSWMPQCGAGSQSMEFELHKDFANIISKVCDEQIKAWDDEYGEHDLEDEEDEE